MTNRELSVRLTLQDELSEKLDKANAAVLKFSANMRKMGADMSRVGRELSQVGRTMAMVGGAITAPLILAYKTTGEYSAVASNQIWAMQMAFRDMSITIGQALIPIVEKFKNGIERLRDAFLSMNPQLREHLIQTVAMTGIWLTVGGVFLATIGRMIITMGSLLKLGSQFIVWCAKSTVAMFGMTVPAWAIIIVIGGIIAAMIKWKGVADFVMNGLEIGWNVLLVIVRAFYLGLQAIFDGIIRGFAFVIGALEKIPSPWKKNLDDCRKFLDTWRGGIEKDMENTANSIKVNSLKIGDIFSGKNGSWAQGFDNLKTGILDIRTAWTDLMKNLNSGSGKSGSKNTNFFTGFMTGLEQSRQALANWADYGKQVAQQLVDSMSTSFSNFFFDAFSGQLKTAQDYFKAFGDAVMKIIADITARLITLWIIEQIVGIATSGASTAAGAAGSIAMGGTRAVMSMHTGGQVKRAHTGMLASDEVPIIAQTGEGVISRRGMGALGRGKFDALNRGEGVGGGTTVNYYIIANDAKSFSDLMRKNKAIIHEEVVSGIRQNGSIRTTMRDYK
jgi:lambda family phage tail tape measure protein